MYDSILSMYVTYINLLANKSIDDLDWHLFIVLDE